MGIQRNGPDGNERQANSIRHNTQGTRAEKTVKGRFCGFGATTQFAGFRIVAFNELYAMAHRPGCNQKGDHQPERIQVVTEQADDPKPPDRGDQNAAQGDQHTVGLAEMENE